MRMRSLRARLALWHAGLLALTLVSLAMLTLALLKGYLTSRADDSLRDYADTTATNIAPMAKSFAAVNAVCTVLPARTPI